MSRRIDADELMKAMYHRAFETDGDTMWQSGCWVRYRAIEQVVKEMPTIEERKTGKWTVGSDMPPMKHRNGKPKKFWPSLRYCSVCGHEAYDDSDWGETLFDWCPYCGADMRGEGHG